MIAENKISKQRVSRKQIVIGINAGARVCTIKARYGISSSYIGDALYRANINYRTLREERKRRQKMQLDPLLNHLSSSVQFKQKKIKGSACYENNQPLDQLSKCVESYGRGITCKQLIEEFHEICNGLQYLPRVQEYIQVTKYHPQLAYALFGFYKPTPYIKRKTRERELIEHLKSKVKQLGRTPLKHEMINDKEYSYQHYYRAFGSLKAALALAGINTTRDNIKLKREALKQDMLQQLKNFYTEHNTWISCDTTLPCKYSHQQYVDKFNTFRNACKVAGIPVEPQVFTKRFSNETLIAHLRKMYHQLGRTPIIADLKCQNEYYSQMLFVRRFGSWSNALIIADVM